MLALCIDLCDTFIFEVVEERGIFLSAIEDGRNLHHLYITIEVVFDKLLHRFVSHPIILTLVYDLREVLLKEIRYQLVG